VKIVTAGLASCTDEELVQHTVAWLEQHLPAGWLAAIESDDRAHLDRLAAQLDVSDWLRRLGSAGYATPSWPEEYGAGLSLSPAQAQVVEAVLARHKVPRSINVLGIGMGGPTLLAWGTEKQKHRYLRAIATDEEIWCQLFSEPGAGSDLAGVTTRAVRDGDDWIVNGQKVWTTLGHVARRGMLLARTDPAAPKHRGLTYFVLDMSSPGVEVRPLVQMTGEAEFNEVFLSDVRVPDSARVGGVGEGWSVARTTLMNERVALSGAGAVAGDALGGATARELIERHRPVTDPALRQRLAGAYITDRIIRLNNERAAAARLHGSDAGPEGSITKLQQAQHNRELQNLAIALVGSDALGWVGPSLHTGRQVDQVAEADASLEGTVRGFLRAQANTIEGGTSNIMRNILGERVLGLPREPTGAAVTSGPTPTDASRVRRGTSR
jgi:alkylation response protein AidB-like acyl-CoA dehydrogenase